MSAPLQQLVGSMSVADFAQTVGLSVENLVSLVLAPERRRSVAGVDRVPKPTTSPKRAPQVEANPRGNKMERAAAYTAKVRRAVLAAKVPVSSADIRRQAGGNKSRCGLALKRLLAEGVIIHDGAATSARRYSPA